MRVYFVKTIFDIYFIGRDGLNQIINNDMLTDFKLLPTRLV